MVMITILRQALAGNQKILSVRRPREGIVEVGFHASICGYRVSGAAIPVHELDIARIDAMAAPICRDAGRLFLPEGLTQRQYASNSRWHVPLSVPLTGQCDEQSRR